MGHLMCKSYYHACSFVVIIHEEAGMKNCIQGYMLVPEPDPQKLDFQGSGSETSYKYIYNTMITVMS